MEMEQTKALHPRLGRIAEEAVRRGLAAVPVVDSHGVPWLNVGTPGFPLGDTVGTIGFFVHEDDSVTDLLTLQVHDAEPMAALTQCGSWLEHLLALRCVR